MKLNDRKSKKLKGDFKKRKITLTYHKWLKTSTMPQMVEDINKKINLTMESTCCLIMTSVDVLPKRKNL